MGSRLLWVCLATALAAAAPGRSQEQASETPEWRVTWYLCPEFGTGHPGATTFIIPDGADGVWTNSENALSAKLWHVSGQSATSPLSISCPRRIGGEPLLGRHEAIRGLLDAARMPDGRLWVASAEGLWEIEGPVTVLHPQVHPISGYMGSFFGWSDTVPPVNSRPCTAVMVDGFGELWAYGSGIGLLRRTHAGDDPKWGVWTRHSEYIPGDRPGGLLQELLQEQPVSTMASPTEGEVILGLASGELLLLKQEADGVGTRVSLVARLSPPEACHGPVQDMMRDSEGRLWCAYANGVARRGDEGWQVWSANDKALPARPITTVCEVRPGRVWVGTDWQDSYVGGSPPPVTGVSELADGRWSNVNPPSYWAEPGKVVGVEERFWKQTITNECTRRITLIRTDEQGRVWVGSHGGLACFEPEPR